MNKLHTYLKPQKIVILILFVAVLLSSSLSAQATSKSQKLKKTNIPAKKVKLVSDTKIIEVGDTFSISAKFTPNNASYQKLSWSVENDWYFDKVVKKISKNKFKALTDGTVTIIAHQKDTNKKYYLKVEVKPALGSFHIENNSNKINTLSTFVGGHLIIKGALDRSQDDWYEETIVFKYSVRDKNIASIDQRGEITALNPGVTDIIVTAPNGKSKSCKLTVDTAREPLYMDTMFADKYNDPIGKGNYGSWSNYAGTDETFLFQLAEERIGVFTRIATKKGQELLLSIYDKNLNFLQSKTIPLPYTKWGGLYQGEDGNYYAAVGQNNTEENDSKIVFSIIKMDEKFDEVGRCNITGMESKTVIPYDTSTARMAMDNDTLIVHTDRERYRSADGLNHQSNITFIINTNTMSQIYVGELFPYNHVSHSFNQYVKLDGRNLMYVDHGDAYPRSIVHQTHYNFAPTGWSDNYRNRPTTNELDLIRMKGAIGDNFTGIKVNGFEIGSNYNIVSGVSIPHDTLVDSDIKSYKVQNVYVSLISKDGTSSNTIWLTDYKEGGKISASNLRMLKLTDDKFALIYQINNNGTYKTGLFLINSTGTILEKKEYDVFYSCYAQPLYANGAILWIDDPMYVDEYYHYYEQDFKKEKQFTRIYVD